MIEIIRHLRHRLAKLRSTARARRKYADSIIHGGVQVDRSSLLGRHNVLFERVVVVDSIIGNHTYIQHDSVVVGAEIGKYCSIGSQVNIGLPQHALNMVSSHPAFYLLNTPLAVTYSRTDRVEVLQRTVVGNDVWIGQGAMIMSGVRIGTGAVVGAGAVVTRDVPDYAVAAGVPARVIRFRFGEDVRRRLLDSRWWDMPNDWLRSHVDSFIDPERLIADLAGAEAASALPVNDAGSSTGRRS